MSNINKLLDIMAQLRDPLTGCPWDLQQDARSILPHTLEEVYEVAETIEQGDQAALQGELGDLLFQIVFLARLAEEDGHFNFADVVDSISEKLLRRHPHVFDAQASGINDPDGVKTQWESIKATERQRDFDAPVSQVADIPNALPAIQRAFKLGQRTSRVGFDWETVDAVQDQVHAELTELSEELDRRERDPERVAAECGDVLFSMVQLCRHLGIQAEMALRACNRRFSQRFQAMEADAGNDGRALEDLTSNDWEHYWQRAKRQSVED